MSSMTVARPEVGPLGYRPGLDGLRGIAIGLVLLAHFGLPDMPELPLGAPSIGVDLFFVLSGFLITRLLLDEAHSAGRISLRGFWARRGLRLMPLSTLVIVIVALVTVLAPNAFFRTGDMPQWRAIVAALLYHMNWLQAFPSTHHDWALTATWSLSLEEQFYLVWPLVVVLGLRFGGGRRLGRSVATASVIVIVASAITRALLVPAGSWHHVYNGLDSRAGQLAAGTLLAAISVTAPGVVHRLGRLGPLGLIGLALVAGKYSLDHRWSGLGYDVVAWMSVVAIAGALAGTGWFGRVLADPTLRWLGVRAYAIYLVHFPLFMMLTHQHLPAVPIRALQIGRIAVALVIADVLHRLVERPSLRLRKRSAVFNTAAPSSPTIIPATPASTLPV